MRSRALLLAPIALLVAACGSSSSSSNKSNPAASGTTGTTSSAPPATTGVSSRTLAGLGAVLVNAQGKTLYVYAPEKAGKVQCTGSCAAAWPPLAAPSAQKPVISGAVNSSMVSSVANPTGGTVVTYDGWPLHTYASDSAPGQANGQGVAGQWHVISPTGKVITRKASSSGGSGRGGGYGSGGGSSPY